MGPLLGGSANEQRWAQRRSSLIPGYLFSDQLAASVNVVIRDMSSTGAKLELMLDRFSIIGSSEGLPNNFSMFIRRDDTIVECTVAWREPRFIGVRFIGHLRHVPKRYPPAKLIKSR